MPFAPCVLFAASGATAGKIARIAYLTTASSPAELPRLDSFRQGLRALGHIEGQNIAIEVRHTDGKFDRLAEIAAEIVRSKVDVLVVAAELPVEQPSKFEMIHQPQSRQADRPDSPAQHAGQSGQSD